MRVPWKILSQTRKSSERKKSQMKHKSLRQRSQKPHQSIFCLSVRSPISQFASVLSILRESELQDDRRVYCGPFLRLWLVIGLLQSAYTFNKMIDPPPTIRRLTSRSKTPIMSSTEKFKGCAFLEFSKASGLQTALRLHHSELGGRKINVELSAGGGGKSDARMKKVKEKNAKLEVSSHLLSLLFWSHCFRNIEPNLQLVRNPRSKTWKMQQSLLLNLATRPLQELRSNIIQEKPGLFQRTVKPQVAVVKGIEDPLMVVDDRIKVAQMVDGQCLEPMRFL
jgi:RNA recognition motif-containing protein